MSKIDDKQMHSALLDLAIQANIKLDALLAASQVPSFDSSEELKKAYDKTYNRYLDHILSDHGDSEDSSS